MNQGRCPCHPGNKAQRLFGACDPITGNRFEVVECEECGLARTAPQLSPDELDREVEQLATAIAGKSREAIAAGKRLFYEQRELSIEAAYGKAGEVMAENATMGDARRGIARFTKRSD